MAKKCSVKTVKIKSKRGKRIIAEFRAHVGSGCPPRKKPKTGHLSEYKKVMKKASPQCARAHRGNRKAFRNCIKQAFRSTFSLSR